MSFIKYISVFIFLVSFNCIAAQVQPMHMRQYSVQFLDEMTVHHEGGVKMADMAISKAFHSELREMANKMKSAQLREIAMMKEWRKDLFPTAPIYKYQGAEMDMSKLENLTGNAFDLAFLDSMIMHHPGAIFLGREAAARSGTSEIRSFGNKIAQDQTKEVIEMRKMRDMWTTE